MGKKRQILGFLSICVFCIFALMGNVGAVTCDPSTYLDGDTCVNCPGDYPKSDAGATSINQCFVHYDGECVPGTCPENSTSCTWKTSENISVDDYYGMPTNKTCKVNTLFCQENYYIASDDQSCKLCAEIPGTKGVYDTSSGWDHIETCYYFCLPDCVHDKCPAHGECTYEDMPAGGGGIYYPNNIYTTKCEVIVPSSCAMKVTCVDTGYTTFDPDTVTCNANELTINYDANGGTGNIDATICFYDQACSTSGADAISRSNWEFTGWNTAADGTGRSYAVGADITNIISDGAITLYAQWKRLRTPCEAGKYYDSESQVPCPVGSFCPGIGDAPAGESGCAVKCPNGGTSLAGAELQSQCFVTCPEPATIKNGTLSQVNENEYNDGTSDTYPTCTYHATCNVGYIAKNDNSTAPKCVWENPAKCPVGFYCPDGADEPIACPRIKDDDSAPRGTSEVGTRVVTDCYYIFAPWDNFKNGNASGKCKYTNDTARYSACNLERAFSCLPGYYHLSEQTVGCTGVQQGYFSDGTTMECLADNYQSAECVASLSQKECPEKLTNSTVASAEFATSITQCSKECVRSDPHGTVSRKNERVNATTDGEYEACEFTVTCDTGYTPVDNGTENARCVARQYTITLDKNGGAGDVVDNITCTFDSGVCNLPSNVALSRPGYSLVPRWCERASGDGTCYTAGTTIATNISTDGTDITLYAVWTPNVYEVALNSNDATTAVSPSRVYLKYSVGWFTDADSQTPISRLITIPVKTGYNFSGFFDSTKSVRIISDSGELLMSDQVLTFTTQNATISANWAAGLTECAAGTYYTGAGAVCATCTANNYCSGGNFATDAGVAGYEACPAGGTSAAGAASADACYKSGQPYSASHGAGTQTCYYDISAQTYTNKCENQLITSCNAGYWLNSDVTSIDCSPVGIGYYSVGGGLNRDACPTEDSVAGTTDNDNSSSVSDCFMANRVYDLNNGGALYGRGTQTCYYNISALKYNDRCIRDSIKITYCNAGYWFDLTQNKYDCVPVGKNFYSEIGDVTRNACPAPKSPESGTPNTRGNTTTDSAEGCFLTRELTTALHGRGRWGCFYNADASVMDYTNCSNPEMYECDAGYYYKSSVLANDCIAVGRGNYSPALDTALHACPSDGYTLSDTAGNSTDCLKDEIACNVQNGFGLQTCAFNGTNAYNNCNCANGCTVCSITGCDSGYSMVGNMCIMCPADNVCSGGAQNTCASLTDGMYPNSDAGTTDVSQCWRECPMGANAIAMSGRDYYGGDSNCAISQCKQGYSLQNGVCVACPAGSYCDGTDSDINGKSCKTLGDGSWNLSAPGASSASECYKECKQYNVDNGTAIPLEPRAYWDENCEYRGKSDLGNDCDIIDGVCIETSCINIYEMINGRCKPCNREHALSYAADGNCVIASCEIGYHVEDGKCVADTRECTAPNASIAHQSWDYKLGSYSTCVIEECADGYHVASNACVSDIQVCDIENGVGAMEWNHSAHTWGNCIATSCNAGYTTDPSQTNERWKQCGECKNKFSVRGELAVSTYVRECEIASCLYQGEMYNLENNECVPICDVNGYEDETGTMKWNPVTHKCERHCKSGYRMW